MAYLETYELTDVTGAQFDEALNLVENSVAVQFSTEESYNVGDYVMKDGLLYMCIDDDFVPGPWDASQWEQHRIFDNNYAIIDGGTKTKNI